MSINQHQYQSLIKTVRGCTSKSVHIIKHIYTCVYIAHNISCSPKSSTCTSTSPIQNHFDHAVNLSPILFYLSAPESLDYQSAVILS